MTMLSGITKLAFLCGYATVFLHAAGIGEKHARGLFEGDDVEIAYESINFVVSANID